MGEVQQGTSDVKALVDRIQNGDSTAFERLIEPKVKNMLYLALHFTGNLEDAEECCKQTILKAYQNIQGLASAQSFDSWIYRLLKQTCDERKKKVKQWSFKSIVRKGSKSFGSLKLKREAYKREAY